MIVLDHNIPEDQAEQLRRRRIHFRQVGFEVGRPEWDDQQEILRFLHATKQITFFTRDLGFFRARFGVFARDVSFRFRKTNAEQFQIPLASFKA